MTNKTADTESTPGAPTKRPVVKIQQLPHAVGLALPSYQTSQAAGCDLAAALPEDKPITLSAGTYASIPTGLIMQLAPGTEAQVRPRSGLALKHGVTVLNSPGTIDADYRGEVSVLLVNHSQTDFVIERGMRIAQLVVANVVQVDFQRAQQLAETDRGTGGFGSTGQ